MDAKPKFGRFPWGKEQKPYFVTVVYHDGKLEHYDFDTEQQSREFMAKKLKEHKEGTPRIIGVSFGERK